jgi:hypothetical protein
MNVDCFRTLSVQFGHFRTLAEKLVHFHTKARNEILEGTSGALDANPRKLLEVEPENYHKLVAHCTFEERHRCHDFSEAWLHCRTSKKHRYDIWELFCTKEFPALLDLCCQYFDASKFHADLTDSPWAIAPVSVADILVVAVAFVVVAAADAVFAVVASPGFVSGSQLEYKQNSFIQIDDGLLAP